MTVPLGRVPDQHRRLSLLPCPRLQLARCPFSAPPFSRGAERPASLPGSTPAVFFFYPHRSFGEGPLPYRGRRTDTFSFVPCSRRRALFVRFQTAFTRCGT